MWRSGIAGPAVGVPSLVLLTVMAFKLAYLLTGSSDWVLQFAGRVARGWRDQSSPPARLVEAQHVAGGIAEGAVADTVRLVDRLLQHLGTRGADALESGVAVVGAEDDTAQQALRQQFRRGRLVGGRGVRGRDRRFEDDLHIRLRRRADGHPAHPLEPDVVAHLQAEHVAVEGERLVVVVDGDEAL